ncbi:TatD family hydrolase [Natrarchaeobius sp. A-rgal3]|uniref:TatD family hydrolase n=1 Tax=Natrarchaeobius versutus TaxID=1679078 RepID=UPI00350F167F
MNDEYPTARPIARVAREDAGNDDETELPNVPWVDVHNHAHTLSWGDREKYALSGCESMVTMAAGYHWTPYRPVEPADVRYLWDDALARLGGINDAHPFDASLGIGIHTGARVDRVDELLSVMPSYLELEEVDAVGEVGLTPSQHGSRWPLEEQKAVTRAQFQLAREYDLPAITHTPSDPDDVDVPFRERRRMPGYEKESSLQREPVFGSENVKRDAIEHCLELKDEAGLADDRLVLSHGTTEVAPFVLENTDCYLSFTVSYPWLLGVGARDVAAVIDEYGPERVLVETDAANVLRGDAFAFKRTIFDLYRMGIDVETIRTVVYENPQSLLE